MELTNRELAYAMWLAILAIGILVRPSRARAVGQLLSPLRGKLAAVFLAFWGWAVIAVLVAWQLGVWDRSLLKETALWIAVPGTVLLMGFRRAYEGRGYYASTLIGVFGLSALLEVYLSLGSFSLPIELALVPLVVLLAGVSVVAARRRDGAQAKRLVDGCLAVVGLAMIAAAGTFLVGSWQSLGAAGLLRLFALPVWLTATALPFVFVFSLFANYEDAFSRLDWWSKDNPSTRRRAKLALLTVYGLRNRELHRFAGQGPRELAASKSWGDARRIVAYHRAVARVDQAQVDMMSAKLARYAGVEGTDPDGEPLDQREFAETKRALKDLHYFHQAQHRDGKYRVDIMSAVGGLLSKTFDESEIRLEFGRRHRSWWAWRRTPGGWVLGIGAAGGPPDTWTWVALDEPSRGPGPGTDWTHRGFDGTGVYE